jgi:hypothetical protein
VDGSECTGALHWLQNGPVNAERNVRSWPAATTLRTGAPADAESREEAGARGLAATGECGTPAERAARTERGGMEDAGDEIGDEIRDEKLCTKDDRAEGGEPSNRI